MDGGSIWIHPSWIDTSSVIDMQWDPTAVANDSIPTGPWWGDLAFLGGSPSNQGEWFWEKAQNFFNLWVQPAPQIVPGFRHLLAALDNFTLLIVLGASGMGRLFTHFAPTIPTQDLTFVWRTPSPTF